MPFGWGKHPLSSSNSHPGLLLTCQPTGESQEAYDQVNSNNFEEHKSSFGHEALAGAASFGAMKLFEDHQRKEGVYCRTDCTFRKFSPLTLSQERLLATLLPKSSSSASPELRLTSWLRPRALTSLTARRLSTMLRRTLSTCMKSTTSVVRGPMNMTRKSKII